MRFLFILLCLSLLPMIGNTTNKAPESSADPEKNTRSITQAKSINRIAAKVAYLQNGPQLSDAEKKELIQRANNLSDVKTTLIDGTPVVNAPCQFHTERLTPFPPDYTFKNPIFQQPLKAAYNKDTHLILKTSLFQDPIYARYSECDLVEDAGDNITYRCRGDDKTTYYRFQDMGWKAPYNTENPTCLVRSYQSIDGTFAGFTFDAASNDWIVENYDCTAKTQSQTRSINPCLTLDNIRPALPTPLPTCPAHLFSTAPLPKGTQFKNPIFAMTLDSGDNYPVTLTPTSITKESPTLKRQACHLIENNPTNITYFCEWIIKGERNYGFTRFRSIGHEFGLGQFDYGRCQIMQTMSFTPNKDELAQAFDDLSKSGAGVVYTVNTTLCGPTERSHIDIPRETLFPGDACIPADGEK